MKNEARSIFAANPLVIITVLVCWFSAFSARAVAQGTQGQNAVYSGSSCCVGTSAFIDASTFAGNVTNPNFCSVLNYVLLNKVPTVGGVIDARGLPGTTGTSMTCSASPWAGISSSPPATILLPTGTIVIPTPWALPPSTRLIGQGDNLSSGSIIQACTSTTCTSSFSGSAMIQIGSSGCVSSGCIGISAENLILDGQGQSSGGSYIGGIANPNSTQSYIDHVSLYQILGTGLSVYSNASGSGPYTNINFDTGSKSPVSTTVCVSINGLTGTRGVRGLKCTAESNDPQAAVLLDSPNNFIKDVTVVGFYDGIRVGANAPAQSNVLFNVIGDTSNVCYPTCPTPVRAIHISSNGSPNVADLSIIGVGNDAPSGTFTIWDDLTGAQISDPFVGMYALGKAANNGYARFTTSPSVVTWAAGTSSPSGNCAQGSLYSCTGGTTGSSNCGQTPYALWGCPMIPGGVWKGIR
jgi:hypothetical protein